MEKQKLPDTELKVMQVIWHNETPISTVAIREELQKERPWNLSALQTLLGRLVNRSFLKTEKQGKSRYYEPLVSEEEYLAEDANQIVVDYMASMTDDYLVELYHYLFPKGLYGVEYKGYF